MIPKVIHYCWFGHNPLPKSAHDCIKSWKKFLPDYEIKEWNEDNFNVNIVPYTKAAYEAKKYAFVSDYARFWILFHYGGLYFDTDVEVIKPIDDITQRGPFMGCEMDLTPKMKYIGVNPGLGLGVNPNHDFYRAILEKYNYEEFIWNGENTKTVVTITTELLREMGLSDKSGIQNVCGIYIYPSEYFNPYNIITSHIHITENTRTIHKNAASWMKQSIITRLKYRVRELLPEFLLLLYSKRPWKKNKLYT